MNLVELVEALVAAFHNLRSPKPNVIVRWYHDDGSSSDREVEAVYWDNELGAALVHVPRPAQFAGEPGAGDVVDESEVPELDAELVLEFATGERGCGCRDGVCMTNERHPECRERLKREQLDRVRGGERCRDTGVKS